MPAWARAATFPGRRSALNNANPIANIPLLCHATVAAHTRMSPWNKEIDSMAQSLRIGWIGTGVMGHSMASHLLEAGYPLTV